MIFYFLAGEAQRYMTFQLCEETLIGRELTAAPATSAYQYYVLKALVKMQVLQIRNTKNLSYKEKNKMDFKNAAELLTLCEKENCPISEIMKRRECDLAETAMEEVEARMRKALAIMRKSSSEPLTSPRRSIGGLLGGEAQLVERHRQEGKSICGNVLSRAVAYAMGVLEVNSSMGLIVAAPTAGSSGVVPGVFLALQKEHGCSDEELLAALYNSSAVGFLAMRNARQR